MQAGTQKRVPWFWWLCRTGLLVGFVYFFSIFWRVSVAEAQFFGRSDLLPLFWMKQPHYSHTRQLQVKEAHDSGAFLFRREGRPVIVWLQKINGFQHMYGSALVALELGEKASDLVFCGNEYMEAYADLVFDRYGIQDSDLRDRRKDLYHNALGRKVAMAARAQGLSGQAADAYIQRRLLGWVDAGEVYIPHYNEALVDHLPDEGHQGCPGLPPKFTFYSFLGGRK